MARKLLKKNTKVQKVIKKVKETPMNSHQAKAAAMMNVAMPTGEYVETVGRRKTATARVRIYKNPGDFIVNQKAAGQYFNTITNAHVQYNQPFVLTDTKNNYAVSAVIKGSGPKSQLSALIHGIARGLVKLDEAHRGVMKANGLLTRDDRMKETRKIGTGGKARRKRQSPKR
jgi:small subunit ribosomal protein S9